MTDKKPKNKGGRPRVPKKPKKPVGKPAHRPTQERRDLVTLYAVGEVPHETIADIIGISDVTLRKYYRKELDTSYEQGKAEIVGIVYTQAKAGCRKSQRMYLSRVAHLENMKATKKIELSGTVRNENTNLDRQPKTAEEAARMHRELMESLKHENKPDTVH